MFWSETPASGSAAVWGTVDADGLAIGSAGGNGAIATGAAPPPDADATGAGGAPAADVAPAAGEGVDAVGTSGGETVSVACADAVLTKPHVTANIARTFDERSAYQRIECLLVLERPDHMRRLV
jgi:hypothetical protein